MAALGRLEEFAKEMIPDPIPQEVWHGLCVMQLREWLRGYGETPPATDDIKVLEKALHLAQMRAKRDAQRKAARAQRPKKKRKNR